ncbi:MAG: SIS domain-containing protein [Bryobacteraceae bacterium]|nr:SIS domain-containing protein [Bryobacteraceae bacterium]
MISYEKLDGTYLRDVMAQPQALRDTVAGLEVVPGLGAVRENLRAGRLRRLVLTGMGGSYHLLVPLHLRLTAAGFDSILVETSELIHAMPALLDARNVVVVLSQSGASAEIVRLLEREGPLYLGVTNTPGSPLAEKAHEVVFTRAGVEGGVACKTSVTALIALDWVARHLAGEALEPVDLSGAAEEYLSRWWEHVDEMVRALEGAERAFFAGRGPSMAAVGLGAMLQKEAAHFHGEGMSSAALRHGPFEMLGAGSLVVVYEGEMGVELNRALVRDVLATGAKGFFCGPSAEPGPFRIAAAEPVLELLPAQMLSLAAAYRAGREPGKFERITKVTAAE